MNEYIIRAKFHTMELFVNVSCPMTRFFFVKDLSILKDVGFTNDKDNATIIPTSEMASGVVRKLYKLFGGVDYKFNIVKL